MEAIKVHEFVTLDGVIDAPTWTFEYGFDPTMGGAIAASMDGDELHLFVYPLTRGAGPRLFSEDAAPHTLSLAGSSSYDNGVAYLVYRTDG